MSVQVIQRGAHIWEVTVVSRLDDGDVNSYTCIGRVVEEEGDRWFAEVTHWQDIGHTWHRLEGTKARATKKAAVRDLTRRGEKQS